MIDIKQCLECGKSFKRNMASRESRPTFSKRLFCSHQCSQDNRVRLLREIADTVPDLNDYFKIEGDCIITADWHVPAFNPEVSEKIFEVAEALGIRQLLIAGDFLQLDAFSPHTTYPLKNVENAGFDQAYQLMKLLFRSFDKIYWIWYNHCLDEQTECLTGTGWKRFNQLTESDFIYSLDKHGHVWHDPIIKIINRETSDIVTIDSDMINFVCSPEHRIIYRGRNDEEYGLSKISDVAGRVHIPVAGKSRLPEYPIKDQIIKLAAWIYTDGTVERKHLYPSIYQSKKYLKDIIDLLQDLGVEYSVREIKTSPQKYLCGRRLVKNQKIYMVRPKMNNEGAKLRGLIGYPKQLPDWMLSLSQRQFRLFLETMVKGDGTFPRTRNKCMVLYTKNQKDADNLQWLCSINNMRCSIKEYRKGQFRLNISDTNEVIIDNIRKRLIYKKSQQNMWCLVTPKQNFLVRRQGKAYFTGNCEWLVNHLENKVDLNIMARMFYDKIQDNELFVQRYGFALINDKFRVTHPKSYSRATPQVERALAAKCHQHIIGTHGHQNSMGFDASGKFICMQIGGLHKRSKISYTMRDTTHPEWNNGFAWVKDNKLGYYFHHLDIE